MQCAFSVPLSPQRVVKSKISACSHFSTKLPSSLIGDVYWLGLETAVYTANLFGCYRLIYEEQFSLLIGPSVDPLPPETILSLQSANRPSDTLCNFSI